MYLFLFAGPTNPPLSPLTPAMPIFKLHTTQYASPPRLDSDDKTPCALPQTPLNRITRSGNSFSEDDDFGSPTSSDSFAQKNTRQPFAGIGSPYAARAISFVPSPPKKCRRGSLPDVREQRKTILVYGQYDVFRTPNNKPKDSDKLSKTTRTKKAIDHFLRTKNIRALFAALGDYQIPREISVGGDMNAGAWVTDKHFIIQKTHDEIVRLSKIFPMEVPNIAAPHLLIPVSQRDNIGFAVYDNIGNTTVKDLMKYVLDCGSDNIENYLYYAKMIGRTLAKFNFLSNLCHGDLHAENIMLKNIISKITDNINASVDFPVMIDFPLTRSINAQNQLHDINRLLGSISLVEPIYFEDSDSEDDEDTKKEIEMQYLKKLEDYKNGSIRLNLMKQSIYDGFSEKVEELKSQRRGAFLPNLEDYTFNVEGGRLVKKA